MKITAEREAYLREKIVDTLKKNEGLRKRTLAGFVNVHVMEIVSLLYKMCEEGVLRCEIVNDFANMERYEKYYVKG